MEWSAIDFQNIIEAYMIPWGINIILALGIFIFGRWLAKVIVRVVKRILRKTNMDEN